MYIILFELWVPLLLLLATDVWKTELEVVDVGRILRFRRANSDWRFLYHSLLFITRASLAYSTSSEAFFILNGCKLTDDVEIVRDDVEVTLELYIYLYFAAICLRRFLIFYSSVI